MCLLHKIFVLVIFFSFTHNFLLHHISCGKSIISAPQPSVFPAFDDARQWNKAEMQAGLWTTVWEWITEVNSLPGINPFLFVSSDFYSFFFFKSPSWNVEKVANALSNL